ncbi:MAG: hypothetical protein NC937_01015 [Candidatus Omnitrophica bacterium]|nr:hypothetical protein [Candidatus Omnitrophota bacterium]MCM8824722.1 hypothetical protein [Candidatus Omnitrophota bacterium]
MERVFTLRSFLTGIILSIFIAFYDHVSSDINNGSYLAIDHMPVAAITLFFFLTFVVNTLLKRINKNIAFRQGELLLVYCMMLVACSVTEMGLGSQILPIISAPTYYANPQNEWGSLIVPHLRKQLIVTDPDAVTYFFEGLPKGMSIPWGVWIKPLSLWIPFLLVFYFCTICIAVMLRKQWIEREKLVYPLTILPVEMVKEQEPGGKKKAYLPGFFKNPLMWLGFGIAFLAGTMIALHAYNEIIPAPKLQQNIPVFRGTQNLTFRVSFPVIGFVYLANLEVSFSLWFFSLLFQVIKGIFNITGISSTENIGIYGCAGYAIFAHLGTGAMLAMIAYSLYIARSHFRDIWRSAIGRASVDDSGEIMSYKTAFWGFIVGSLLVLGWLKYSGLSLTIGLVFYLFALIIFLVLTRIVCEAGIPTLVATIISSSIIVSMWGSKNIPVSVLVALGLTYVYSADLRTFPMVAGSMSLKIMDRFSRTKKYLFWAIMTAIFVNIVATMFFLLKISYKYGGINLNSWFFKGGPQAPYTYIADLIKNPTDSNTIGWLCRGIGLVVMSGLMFMRQQFLWWPLHPIGFVIGPVWLMDMLWFSIFIAWLIKKIILKYGGARAYEKSKYFFLGLPLGLYTCAGIWVLIDFLAKKHGNIIFWI